MSLYSIPKQGCGNHKSPQWVCTAMVRLMLLTNVLVGLGCRAGDPIGVLKSTANASNLFEVLGLPVQWAKPSEINRAYRRRASVLHPDKFCRPDLSMSDSLCAQATAAFVLLKPAQELLRDTTRQSRELEKLLASNSTLIAAELRCTVVILMASALFACAFLGYRTRDTTKARRAANVAKQVIVADENDAGSNSLNAAQRWATTVQPSDSVALPMQ